MGKTNNILVVGGAGYIGSHTCLALQEAGFRVIVFDNFSTGHRDACFGDIIIEGDLNDKDLLMSTMEEHAIDSVVHFAALIEAGQSVETPLPFFQNNVSATLSLLEAMNICGVKRIIFSSTAAVYGNQAEQQLLSEQLAKQPTNPYGHTKAMVEQVLEIMASAHDFEVVALRYFNASGADPLCRTGERHQPETHLIPLVIEAARGIRPSISVFGTDYNTPDGTCVRDYIHVSDLASGHVAALNKLLRDNNPQFSVFNLGVGNGYSVREIINSVREISGKDFKVIEADRRSGDPDILVADASAAQEHLNWLPKHSNLNDIIADSWRYALAKL